MARPSRRRRPPRRAAVPPPARRWPSLRSRARTPSRMSPGIGPVCDCGAPLRVDCSQPRRRRPASVSLVTRANVIREPAPSSALEVRSVVQLVERDVAPELVAKIPRIVDLGAHLVEPPDIWTPRLPAKYREVGPHVEYHPNGDIVLDGAAYKEAPGTEGPDVAWWRYEDTLTSLKRHIAASGFRPEEVTLTRTTFDEIRPGCWKVPDRIADMDVNHVEAQLCFPNYPRARARSSCGARTATSPSCACVPTTTGWSRSGAAPAAGACCRCASCRSGTPSSPPPRCGATPRAVCTPSRSPRSPPTSVYRASTLATGTRSSRPATRPAPSSACTSARAPRRCRRPPTPPPRCRRR